MFDVEYNDGRYEYTDNSGQKRKYPSFDKLDKCCKHCGEKLGEHNLVLGNLRKNVYICRTCDSKAEKAARKKAHDHRQLVSTRQEVRKSEPEIKTGYVYVFSIPAYQGYVKIGMSIDVDKRKTGANTWTPFQDVIEHGKIYSEDKRRLEDIVHHTLREHVAKSKEWFEVTPEVALKTIRECERKIND